MTDTFIANRDQAAHWNDRAGQTWAELSDSLDRVLAPFVALLVDEIAPIEGGRVLDVGCGSGAVTTSTSITRADCATEAWAVADVTTRPRSARRAPSALRHRWRAATNAERFPAVPPETKVPPAAAGNPARPASQRNAWFSANTAPAPSSQDPA